MAMRADEDTLQSVLLGDVAWALSLKPRDGITRRAAIRSILAAIEGILGKLQSELLNAAELGGPELAFLRGETHVHVGNGADNVPSELRLRQRVELTAVVLARLRPECQLNFDVTGWRDLLSSLDIRDRLKHAPDTADLEVTDVELAAAVNGYAWFLDNVVAVAQSGFQDAGHGGQNERHASPHARSESLDADSFAAGMHAFET